MKRANHCHILQVTRYLLLPVVLIAILALLAGGGPAAAAPTALVNVKLSGTMQPDGDVDRTAISPDSRYVVFRADAETEQAFELFSAPTTGQSPPARLSGYRCV